MGIKGLAQVIGDFAAGAIKDQDIKAFFGRYIRIYTPMKRWNVFKFKHNSVLGI